MKKLIGKIILFFIKDEVEDISQEKADEITEFWKDDFVVPQKWGVSRIVGKTALGSKREYPLPIIGFKKGESGTGTLYVSLQPRIIINNSKKLEV